MSWLFPAVIANIVTSLVLTLSYTYLFQVERKPFLRVWAIAWGMYTLRFIVNIPPLLGAPFQSFFRALYYFFSFCNCFFLFKGVYLFQNIPFKKWMYWLPGIIGLWCLSGEIFRFSLLLSSLPVFILCGVLFIWLGIQFINQKELQFRKWRLFIGFVFIGWGIHKLDYPFLRPFGSLVPWGYLIGSVLALVVALASIFLYFRIIHHGLRQSENALLKKQKEREQLFQEMEQFTYTVSHDLKSPLITIKGFLGLLEEDVQEEDWEQFQEDKGRIETAVANMQELLDDLLEFSRVGRFNNPSQKIEVSSLVEEVLALLAGPINEKGIKVILEPMKTPLYGDRVRIKQVFQNFIENSLKYTSHAEKPFIRIGETLRQGEVAFFVEDNGPGIPPEYQEKIFGLFEQLNESAEGTGVGLALVKRIIDFHHGRVWVESDGPGTVFLFSIPPAFPA